MNAFFPISKKDRTCVPARRLWILRVQTDTMRAFLVCIQRPDAREKFSAPTANEPARLRGCCLRLGRMRDAVVLVELRRVRKNHVTMGAEQLLNRLKLEFRSKEYLKIPSKYKIDIEKK